MPIPFFNSPNGFFVKKLHPDPVSPDADQDGLPDEWEQRHGGEGADLLPWKDEDGDGWTNLEEYLNGTNPRVGDDPMREQSPQVATGNLWDK